MYINHTCTLSPGEVKELTALTNQCKAYDHLTLSFPSDGDHYWILKNDSQKVIAYFALCKIHPSLWECYGFTCPDCRENGYFSQLLNQVLDYCEEKGDPDLVFVTDGQCPQALHVLAHLEAVYSHSEYMMSLSFSSPDLPVTLSDDMGLNFHIEPNFWGNHSLKEQEISLCAWPDTKSSRLSPPPITCHLRTHGRNVYLFSLETRPEYRRQGLTLTFLNRLVQILRRAGYHTLLLQVSGSNQAALKLYQKTGFQITETLSYYLY